MTIKEIFNTWYEPLKLFLDSQRFIDIGRQVAKDRMYYDVLPSKKSDLLFRTFNITDYNKLKVVILGKEPDLNYDGLAFSDRYALTVKPLLRDVLREIELDFHDGFSLETTGNTDLSKWSEQGVLLLNTSLTTKHQLPASHQQLWYPFVLAVIRAICQKNDIIWLSFENYTQQYKRLINNPSHIIMNFKIGDETFKKVNEDLNARNLEEIIW